MTTHDDLALLVLEDGRIFRGRAWGARGRTLGEVVFATSMTGYQETLTDPSYHQQIVVMTSPHIGNTGVNSEDSESSQIWVAGFVVRDPARRASNWRASGELEEELIRQDIVGIADVDTRAITRHIRSHGAMRGGIFSGTALPAGAEYMSEYVCESLVRIVQDQPHMAGSSLSQAVSTSHTYVVPAAEDGADNHKRVVAVDLGIKSRTPEQLAARGVDVYVLPQDITAGEILELEPDGVFFSNGPGDPSTAEHQIGVLRAILDQGIPFFGICFSHQLFGRALGFGTYKLEFGHRGVNQPVRDERTGRVEITSHNHGFAVDVPVGEPVVAPFGKGRYGRVEVSHIDLNDRVVEGLRALDIPAFSVQFHPEAAAGPHDGEHLFDQFVSMLSHDKEDASDASAH